MISNVDKNSWAYKAAYESITELSFDQPNRDKMNYRKIAMESITSPDSGMVVDRLYKNVMSRASINFGKIPESAGDLTKFARYKTIADTLQLLNRQLVEYNIPELKLAQELHDTIIKCREDFMYGFKVDSQFLKTTYNTMVYALCEMLSLCDVIYVDMLKAAAEGRRNANESYKELLLVQNAQKFVDMYKSGEWTSMVNGIRKDAKNLLGALYTNYDHDGTIMSQLTTAGVVGVPGIAMLGLRNPALKLARDAADREARAAVAAPLLNTPHYDAALHSRLANDEASRAVSKVTSASLKDYVTAGKGALNKILKPTTIHGKIALAIVGIIVVLLIARQLIFLFYRGGYKLNDILDDQENLLKAHIDDYTANGNNAPDRQIWLYNKLANLQNNIRNKILKSDSEGRKLLKQSNAEDFSTAAFQADAVAAAPAADDDFEIS